MSRDTVVAKRYAKALFELAQEQSIVSQVEEQLKLVVDSFGERTRKLLNFWIFQVSIRRKRLPCSKERSAIRVSALLLQHA